MNANTIVGNRQYHVGLARSLSWLKRLYYNERDWIQGQYYVKPKEPAWLEWLHCLVSKKHAEHTWLRITPEAEQQALTYINRVIIALFVLAGFFLGMAYGEYRMLQHYQQHPEQIQIESE